MQFDWKSKSLCSLASAQNNTFALCQICIILLINMQSIEINTQILGAHLIEWNEYG